MGLFNNNGIHDYKGAEITKLKASLFDNKLIKDYLQHLNYSIKTIKKVYVTNAGKYKVYFKQENSDKTEKISIHNIEFLNFIYSKI